MNRVPNWDVKLVSWAAGQIGKPYDWGRTDCGTLVRRAHRLMYGRDIFRIRSYSTKREALQIISETGGVEAVLRETAVEVDRNFVQQGDVLIGPADSHGLPFCAVVVAGGLLSAALDGGVQLLPPQSVEGVFLRVPHG